MTNEWFDRLKPGAEVAVLIADAPVAWGKVHAVNDEPRLVTVRWNDYAFNEIVCRRPGVGLFQGSHYRIASPRSEAGDLLRAIAAKTEKADAALDRIAKVVEPECPCEMGAERLRSRLSVGQLERLAAFVEALAGEERG